MECCKTHKIFIKAMFGACLSLLTILLESSFIYNLKCAARLTEDPPESSWCEAGKWRGQTITPSVKPSEWGYANQIISTKTKHFSRRLLYALIVGECTSMDSIPQKIPYIHRSSTALPFICRIRFTHGHWELFHFSESRNTIPSNVYSFNFSFPLSVVTRTCLWRLTTTN